MPHPPRIDFPGAHHHAMNRGARKEPIFRDDEDREQLLLLLSKLPERFGVRIHAYALMDNHFHLMIESVRGNLSDAMRRLGADFTRSRNKRYGWDGPLFRGRFRSRLALDDGYWTQLLGYLHLNPVRAGIASDLDAAVWTSHAAYAAGGGPDWLATDELLERLGGPAGYRRFMQAASGGDEPAADVDAEWTPSATMTGTPYAQAHPRAGREEAAVARLEEVLGAPLADLSHSTRGRGANPGAWVAAWWLERHGLTQRGIADRLRAHPISVSRWCRRVEDASGDDPHVGELKAKLLAGG
jgi:REP element-mobilizing transposase RayT